ncbi:MAG: transcription termination/antitermination protein NusG [Acidobacteriaceae bacterium]
MQIPRWYAIYTHPRAEKKTSAYLGLQGIENFLPLYSKVSRWKNGVKANINLPLFPGYLFVRAKFVDRLNILRVPSVVLMVGRGAQPTALPDQEVAVLKARLSQISAQPHPFMSIGDKVRVKSGPLEGLEGFLVHKKNQTRFVLSMDLIMQAMSVEIDPCDIELIPDEDRDHSPLKDFHARQ